jgi:transcriptional regulator with XRE-family HTH domain
MLDMSRSELASAATVAPRTIADFETGARQPHASTLRLIRIALEAAGVEFIDPNGGGPGLRLRE